MCRILGIVADEPAEFRFCLREAPRSLDMLSREHPDGWGVAVWGATEAWSIQKQPLSAFADPHFCAVAGESRGQVLIAHVRRRTVGPVSIENTHPFQRGSWVFAHNGTIAEVDRLSDGTSPERRAEVVGTTDSELFFAYLLTHLDAVGAGHSAHESKATGADIDAVLAKAVMAVASRPSFGACNFLLSDGHTLYAFRMGRTLHLLERSMDDEPRSVIDSPETCSVIEARWTPRQHAVLVASEAITDEPWRAIDEGSLLKVIRRPRPQVSVLAAL